MLHLNVAIRREDMLTHLVKGCGILDVASRSRKFDRACGSGIVEKVIERNKMLLARLCLGYYRSHRAPEHHPQACVSKTSSIHVVSFRLAASCRHPGMRNGQAKGATENEESFCVSEPFSRIPRIPGADGGKSLTR